MCKAIDKERIDFIVLFGRYWKQYDRPFFAMRKGRFSFYGHQRTVL